VLEKVGDAEVWTNSIQGVVGSVGGELAERRDADPETADALAKRPTEPRTRPGCFFTRVSQVQTLQRCPIKTKAGLSTHGQRQRDTS
jgi:hypothetical protein